MEREIQSAAADRNFQGSQSAPIALPLHNGTRWTPRRKMQVVHAVLGGLLSLDEACARYALSLEEFMSWQRLAVRSAAFKRMPYETRRMTVSMQLGTLPV